MPIDVPIRRRLVLWWADAVALQSAIAIVTFYKHWRFGFVTQWAFADLDTYFKYATSMAQGLVPYRDFLVEYPPLAIPITVGPRLLGPRFETFIAGFLVEMLLVNAVAVWLVAREVERSEGIDRVPTRLAWYSAFVLILSPMDMTRYDLFPMLLAFASAAWMAGGRMILGGVTAGVGVLAKLVPGLVIVPVLAAALPWSAKARATIALGLVVVAGVLGWYKLGGDQIVGAIRYHSERGLEMGSIYASGYMVAHEVAGVPIVKSHDHGSFNLVGPNSMLVAKLSPLVQLACLLLVAFRAGKAGPGSTIRLAGAALLAYVIGGKVLSPQYVVWLIPFVVASGSLSARVAMLACCVLTTAVFPWTFTGLTEFHQGPEAILIARNVALIALFALLLKGPTGPEPARSASASS